MSIQLKTITTITNEEFNRDNSNSNSNCPSISRAISSSLTVECAHADRKWSNKSVQRHEHPTVHDRLVRIVEVCGYRLQLNTRLSFKRLPKAFRFTTISAVPIVPRRMAWQWRWHTCKWFYEWTQRVEAECKFIRADGWSRDTERCDASCFIGVSSRPDGMPRSINEWISLSLFFLSFFFMFRAFNNFSIETIARSDWAQILA